MTDSRKVQRLGPSTLAITLPSEWVRKFGVKKGDELSLTQLKSGVMAVSPASATYQKPNATIHVAHMNSSIIERAIIAQYVLGRRVIYIKSDVTLNSETINAIYKAETQLMGLGVVEETPNAMRWVFAAIPIIALQLIGSAYFQAIGKAVPALLLTLTRQGFFFIPLILILPKYFGELGVWISFPLADVISTVVTGLFLNREIRMHLKPKEMEEVASSQKL